MRCKVFTYFFWEGGEKQFWLNIEFQRVPKKNQNFLEERKTKRYRVTSAFQLGESLKNLSLEQLTQQNHTKNDNVSMLKNLVFALLIKSLKMFKNQRYRGCLLSSSPRRDRPKSVNIGSWKKKNLLNSKKIGTVNQILGNSIFHLLYDMCSVAVNRLMKSKQQSMRFGLLFE